MFADLGCIFPYLVETPGLPMPKFSVCSGESWIWPVQGMGTIPWCLFPSLWAIFADLGHIFPLLAETPGLFIPKFSACGGDSLTWPGKGMDDIFGCLFPLSGQYLLIRVHFSIFGRDPWATHAQIFCMWWGKLDLAWKRYGHHTWVSLSLSLGNFC